MANPLSQLEQDLTALATPAANATDPGTPTGALQAVISLFSGLETIDAIQPEIGDLAGAINDGLTAAAQALAQISGQLQSLEDSVPGGNVATLLTTLQNALSTAGSLVPGTSNVSALQSGSQFFGQLSSLLTDLGSVTDAVTTLNEIASQLLAIGSLPTTTS